MPLRNPDDRMQGLTAAQARDLGERLKSFWDGLSPEERAHLNGALAHLVDEGGDVSGHGLTEYAFIVQLIVLASTVVPH
jgi:hypothetical protein